MSVYNAYHDASGQASEPSDPLVVAGLIASVEGWAAFEEEWVAALRDFDVPYFHMGEFAHSNGPFAGWKHEEEKRRAFLGRLVSIILDRVEHAYVHILKTDDFHAVDREFVLHERTGNPYQLVVMGCMESFRDWAPAKHSSVPIEHVVEAGDDGQPGFEAFARGFGFKVTVREWQDESGRQVYPFQAADLFAYEVGLFTRRHLGGERPKKLRWAMEQLNARFPRSVRGMDERAIRAMCARLPMVFPRRVP